MCLPERINFSEECTIDLVGWNKIMHYLFYIGWLESVINYSRSLTMAMAGPMCQTKCIAHIIFLMMLLFLRRGSRGQCCGLGPLLGGTQRPMGGGWSGPGLPSSEWSQCAAWGALRWSLHSHYIVTLRQAFRNTLQFLASCNWSHFCKCISRKI